jgi:uracil-DNA glycosylase
LMSESDPTQQLRQRLAGYVAAGIDWVPAVDAPVGFDTPAPITDTPAVPADSIESRRQELTLLAERVSQCVRCPELAATRTQTVFGVGPVGADICFVGEAPGGDEDRQGEPFVGTAGQMLNRIIGACGLKREEIFICNILRCRPPGNRQPKADECGNCREYLEQTLDIVRPKVICCWGAVAAKNLLQTSAGITKLRGKWYEYRGVPVICTFHPASLLEGRSPENKKYVWEDMKTMLSKIGRPVPGAKKE